MAATITPFQYQQAIDKAAQKRALQRGEDEADDEDYAAARASVDAYLRSRKATVKKSWWQGAEGLGAAGAITTAEFNRQVEQHARRLSVQERGDVTYNTFEWTRARNAVQQDLRRQGLIVKDPPAPPRAPVKRKRFIFFGADAPASNRVLWLTIVPMAAAVAAGVWMLSKEA